jgi:hypothetical protein
LRTFLSTAIAVTLVSLLALPAWSSPAAEYLFEQSGGGGTLGEGWRGFTDISFMINALLALSLATLLGAAIAFHPKHAQTADTLAEIEAPKVYILYSVIGAIIGIMVVKYGLVVGFVLFGIGGLIRFRTILGSARLTGQVIFVTLIGLSCGLDLPHVAVLSTAFGYGLIYLLDTRLIYQADVRGVPPERLPEAAAAYRKLIESQECRIMSEKKVPERGRVTFIFQASASVTRFHLEQLLESEIEPELRGSVDWEVD